MDSVLIHLRPWNPATQQRVDVYVADAAVQEAYGLNATTWEPAVKERPELTIELFDPDISGKVMAGKMSLTLALSQIAAIANPHLLYWTGAPIAVYSVVDLAWDRRLVEFNGKVTSADPDKINMTLAIDGEVDTTLIDKPLLRLEFTGAGGLNGDGDKRGVLKPAGFGTVYNIEPVWFDLTDNIGMIDGYGNCLTIDWLGEGLSSFGDRVADYATYALLKAAIVAGDVGRGQWATSVADGCVGLGAPPEGRITVHATFGAGLPGAFMKRILLTNAQVDVGKIVGASFDALDAAVPFPIGWWTGEQRQVPDLLGAIAASCNASVLVDFQGLCQVTRVAGSAPIAAINYDGSTDPRVTKYKSIESDPPFYLIKARTARPAAVFQFNEVNAVDNIDDTNGIFDAGTVYRYGDIVYRLDGSSFLYINEAAEAGHVPPAATAPPAAPAADAWWQQLLGVTTYADGTPIDSLKPAALGADVTGANTAAAIAGQGSLATLSQVTLGTNVYRSGGGPVLVNADVITNLGTAAAIAGQGGLATKSTVKLGTGGELLREDNSTHITDLLAITGLGTAAAISGQGTLATLSQVTLGTNVYRSGGAVLVNADVITALGTAAAIAGQGALATLGQVTLGTNVYRSSGPLVTDATAITALGTAAAIAGQGSLATLSGVNLGTNVYRSTGGAALVDADLITTLGTAAGIAGQGALATLGQVNLGTSGRVYRDDGSTRLTDALAVTALGTAAAIAGQAAIATDSDAVARILAMRGDNFIRNGDFSEGGSGYSLSASAAYTALGAGYPSTYAIVFLAGGTSANCYAIANNSTHIPYLARVAYFSAEFHANGVSAQFYLAVDCYDGADAYINTAIGTITTDTSSVFKVSEVALTLPTGTAKVRPFVQRVATIAANQYVTNLRFAPTQRGSTLGSTFNLNTFRNDGTTLVTDAAAVTSLGTAAAIAGQGSFATLSQITNANVGTYMGTFAINEAQLNTNAVRLGANIRRNDGSTFVTDATAITALGTAAAISGQGSLATLSSVGATNLRSLTTANLLLDPTLSDTVYWTNSGWTLIDTATGDGFGPSVRYYLASPNGNGTTAQGESGYDTPAGQLIPVEKGRTYRVSARAYASAGFTGVTWFRVSWFKANGAASAVTPYDYITAPDHRTVAAGAGGAETIDGFLIAPSDAAFAQVSLRVAWSATLNNAGTGYLALPVFQRAVDGQLAINNAFRLGTHITRADGSTSLTDALAVTSLGTAAAISGQGALATLAQVNLGASGRVYRDDGSTRLTDALAVTALGTAAGIAGQGALATLGQVNLGTSGRVYRDDGSTRLTDALAVTALGTAAAIAGQGTFATLSSISSTIADSNNLFRRSGGGLYLGDLSATLGDNFARNGFFDEGPTGIFLASDASYRTLGAAADPAAYGVRFAANPANNSNSYFYVNNAAYLPYPHRDAFVSFYVKSAVATTVTTVMICQDIAGNDLGVYPQIQFAVAASGAWQRFDGKLTPSLPVGTAKVVEYFIRSGALTATMDVTGIRIAPTSMGATLGSTFNSNAFRNDGTTLVTDALAVTSLGTAAGIAGQGALATRSTVRTIDLAAGASTDNIVPNSEFRDGSALWSLSGGMAYSDNTGGGWPGDGAAVISSNTGGAYAYAISNGNTAIPYGYVRAHISAWFYCTGAVAAGDLFLGCGSNSGTITSYVGVSCSVPAVGAWYRLGGWVTLPAGTGKVLPFWQKNNPAGCVTYMTGLRVAPTEMSADLTRVLTLAPAQAVQYDYTGSTTTQLPKILTCNFYGGGTDVTPSTSFVFTAYGCTIDGTGCLTGQVRLTGVSAANAAITVDATYLGATRSGQIPIQRILGINPGGAGGGGAGATGFSVDVSATITDTTYDGSPQPLYTTTARMRSNGSGQIRLTLNGEYHASGTDTAQIIAKAQKSTDGTTWSDAGLSATGTSASGSYWIDSNGNGMLDADDTFTDEVTGTITANSLVSGFTASTDYYIRWIGYKAGSLASVGISGTASGAQS